ncbi:MULTISPECIES: ExbD/TolR family protein [unclassified Colwellia]|uniref:ExbD/TolR family protein n=1 Tax=unclassified Colwellia TaxID=196834 RepID=UPI0015F62EC1|nr:MULTISPECIES: biopolymer transporter ExbD [unclassified Colwellia]MBA6231410.1 biopolymer transporter ExbD [Colwellia sp. MB02u-7]MBA6234994.1 biopolymer transporter ExbD [Colwellia sp. MB02u-11]MBA6254426.1 biopolymer transporter ExbD [Colwellia sp. MB3u-28]MBA6258672.1 biopolymer transporter ExbD [Colwellia sp. MB3u-41]MBA6297955.1 biopolymer transporter ExbD [Colwellia sp. MB3u-22]
MRKNRLYEDQKAEADMTPMLDIVFILLIFFIVTTSFVKEQGFLVNKPDGGNPNQNNNPMLLIRINESGLVSLNGRITDIERLPANIENYLATNQVSAAVVIPHVNTYYDNVVKVIDHISMVDGLTLSIGK